MTTRAEAPFLQLAAERRATTSFSPEPVVDEDLDAILSAGLWAPSSWNLQPWRFVVVRSAEGRRRLREACYNQVKLEEAPVVIVACGDADGWRNGDLDETLRQCREEGMTERYVEATREHVPEFLSEHPNLSAWLHREVMLALTTMMWAAESLGYDTAPVEGFDRDRLKTLLKLPMSYETIMLLALGHARGEDTCNGRRFGRAHTVFEEEYPKPPAF